MDERASAVGGQASGHERKECGKGEEKDRERGKARWHEQDE